MTTAPMRQWIGYDWFKLIVAMILVLLLLSFWRAGLGTPAAQVVPAAAPAATVAPAAAAVGCNSLAVNCDAWVTRTGGRILRLRSGAGTNQTVLFKLPVGTQMKLLERPTAANGYTWWRVATIGGREGWVAGQELRIAPD